MSKKGSLLSAAFTGKRKKRGGGLTLGSTWGNGRNNALTTGWGGKSRHGGGGMIPRAFGGKSKRGSLLIPATWEKRRRKKKGSKLLQRAFGLFRRKGEQSKKLDAVWSKRARVKPGTILSVLGKQARRRSRKPAPGNIMSIVEAASQHGKKGAGRVPRNILGALGAVGSRLTRDDRPTPPQITAEALAEAEQTVTGANAQAEAQQSKDLLRRVAEWIRERLPGAPPA
jgi:hypothetical protein